MNTLALSSPNQSGGWDLVINASGNLAINTGGIALAQDVASACMVFRGECWLDVTLGVPYYQQILGHRVSLQFVKQALIQEAMKTPDVSNIVVYLTGPSATRAIGGQMQISSAGTLVAVAQTGDLLNTSPWWSIAALHGATGATT